MALCKLCYGHLPGPARYLGLVIRQEEVGTALVFGRARAIDEELHVYSLFLVLVHPLDAL